MTPDPEEKKKKRKDKKNAKPLRRKPAAEDSDTSSSDKDDTHAEEALANYLCFANRWKGSGEKRKSSQRSIGQLSLCFCLFVLFIRSKGIFEWMGKEAALLPTKRKKTAAASQMTAMR
jgi:hypothetical protein